MAHVILSVWYATSMARNLLPDECWRRTSGDKNGCACGMSQWQGGLFPGPGGCFPKLDPDKCQTQEHRCKINWSATWVEFSCLKKKEKKRCRKRTASYDLILLKIPGYVSTSLLVPDFFLLTFRLNSASLKGNKCQLHKEVVLIFFPEYFELRSKSILFNSSLIHFVFSQIVNIS